MSEVDPQSLFKSTIVKYPFRPLFNLKILLPFQRCSWVLKSGLFISSNEFFISIFKLKRRVDKNVGKHRA